MLNKIFSFFFKKKKSNFSEIDFRKREKILNFIHSIVGRFPINDEYYIKAFTHRSYLEKTSSLNKSNERLEFLGDSILGKIVAEYLFKKYPDKDEGFLTKSRSHLVDKDSLKKIGFSLELQKYLFLNDTLIISDKNKLSKIVADCMEAIIAAIYLDLGEDVVRKFVHKYLIIPQINNEVIYLDKNYKGQLLEYSHANKLEQPEYKVIEQVGPEHEKIFTIGVFIGEKEIGIGKGKSKKNAEQNAAKKALKRLNQGH